MHTRRAFVLDKELAAAGFAFGRHRDYVKWVFIGIGLDGGGILSTNNGKEKG
jgi:hypothetical protein